VEGNLLGGKWSRSLGLELFGVEEKRRLMVI